MLLVLVESGIGICINIGINLVLIWVLLVSVFAHPYLEHSAMTNGVKGHWRPALLN